MNITLLRRSLLTWLLFIPLPVTNGFLREFVYKQYIGPRMSEIIGTIFICVAFITVQYLLNKQIIAELERRTLLLIGLVWAVLTIFFEFVLGLFILKMSFEQVIGAYNIAAGRIWIFVILTIFFTPLIVNYLVRRQHVPTYAG